MAGLAASSRSTRRKPDWKTRSADLRRITVDLAVEENGAGGFGAGFATTRTQAEAC